LLTSVLWAAALSDQATAADVVGDFRSNAWGSRLRAASATNGGNSAAAKLGKGFIQLIGLPFQIVRAVTSTAAQAAQTAMKKGADNN
jgi:hypothetical protein